MNFACIMDINACDDGSAMVSGGSVDNCARCQNDSGCHGRRSDNAIVRFNRISIFCDEVVNDFLADIIGEVCFQFLSIERMLSVQRVFIYTGQVNINQHIVSVSGIEFVILLGELRCRKVIYFNI